MTIASTSLNQNLNFSQENFMPTPKAFKFYDANSSHFLKSLEEQVLENIVWMSSVSQLNDPLEMSGFLEQRAIDNILVDTQNFLIDLLHNPQALNQFRHLEHILNKGGTIKTIIEMLEKWKQSGPSNTPEAFFDELASQGYDLKQQSIDTFKESNQRVIKNSRIFCTTSNLYNIAMWSYYANNHTGLAIEYKRDSQLAMYSRQVTYIDRAPSLTLKEFEFTSTKNLYFQHESERRYIEHIDIAPREGEFIDEGSNLFKFNDDQPIVKSIHFGVATPSETKEKVIKIIETAPYDIFVTETHLSQATFSIDFRQILPRDK